MNPLTLEWVEKAEADLATARRETRAWVAPNPDAACFHAQQCIEKYLKAILHESGVPFPKTHDLVALADLAEPYYPPIREVRRSCAEISAYAVLFRYPGEKATRVVARGAVAAATAIRHSLRQGLRLPPRR